ncbi:hypothetical protein BDV37DRAFT_281157 [Aspergillus pseudonomiae]|uniref:Uncharacterized protein n=1 Tax=Aspergillus pseudonomiae TaxID=1506151 RepID=A0A5N7DII8_9EURO|nr:uncharacterized protein BDV37DRAFT_281157 [Aspergillus pseudonomiae]KAE8406247.1 hypothetical protein BDV37DRAFT_281157 [Aspergillus pseudonomiae]
MAKAELPGFPLPLNLYDYSCRATDRFPHVLRLTDMGDEYVRKLCTYRELLIMRVLNSITDKPGWYLEVFDEATTAKWRREIAASDEEITPNMVRWIMDEVKWKAQKYSATGHVVVFDSGVVKSDTAISDELQNALKEGVRILEDSLTGKDCHPGSDDKVADLVDPSLFPVVFNRTRAISDSLIKLERSLDIIGHGTVLLSDTREHPWFSNRKQYSWEFQWLPCDVDLLDNGLCAIVSYINNLHPRQNARLYRVIEKIIAQAIPLWNTTLTYTKRGYWRMECPRLVEYDDSDSDYDSSEGRRLRPVGIFQETGLQIIVKLVNIELTPEKPEYHGGSWHVQGRLNEHICASAIYYYDSDNITEGTLSFRQRAFTDLAIWDNMKEIYQLLQDIYDFPVGIYESESIDVTQELGSVVTKEGRLLTFANILQHRESPFSLEDRSRPGHRKILALLLVDPHLRIISSSNVPPQREDWAIEREMTIQQALRSLPQELKDMVYANLDFAYMTMEEAKGFRLRLIEERRSAAVTQNEYFETTIMPHPELY